MSLAYFAVFFAIGVYTGAFISPLYFPIFSLLACVPGYRFRNAPLAALALTLGALSLFVQQQKPENSLENLVKEESILLSAEGVIQNGPFPAFAADGKKRSRFDLRVKRMGPNPGEEGDWKEIQGVVRLTANTLPEGMMVGDRVRVQGSFSSLPLPNRPNALDSRQRLRESGVHSLGFAASVVVLGKNQTRGISWLRARATHVVEQNLEGEARAVVGALVLGEKGALPPELRKRFVATGTAHLLAVSGGHVLIVALIVRLLLGTLILRIPPLARFWVPSRISSLVSIPVVFSYVMFVGASPSSLRAGFAACFVFFLNTLGRKVASLDLIALSAMISLCYKPSELFGPSLQLSFAAVLGLCLLLPRLKSFFAKILPSSLPKTRRRRCFDAVFSLFQATLAASIATAPIVAWHFYQTAPASFLANLILVPFFSLLLLPLGLFSACLAMLGFSTIAGFGFVFLGFLWKGVSLLFLWVFPKEATDLVFYSYELLFFYLLILSIFFLRHITRIILISVLVFSWLAVSFLPDLLVTPSLRMTFLPVGQGDNTVIEFPDGKVMLIDGGGQAIGHNDPGSRVIIPFLRFRGIRSIDVMAVSHPHPDHFGGLASVAEAFPVHTLWTNGGESQDPRYLRLIEATRSAKHASPKAGSAPYQDFFSKIGGAHFDFLGPSQKGVARPYQDENDNSIVFRMSYEGSSILFTGDAEKEAEEAMVAKGEFLRADLLKVGHHGSRTSSTAHFLEAVNPEAAIACLGRKNQFGFPHKEVAKRYKTSDIPFWRTDQGAIEVIMDTHGRRHIRHRVSRSFLQELWPF